MVSLVWFILSLNDICAFGWLPVLMDFAIASIILGCIGKHPVLWRIATGCACFAFLKCFMGLDLTGWWILISPLVFSLLLVIPGGFSLFLLLFSHIGILSVPACGLVVSATADVAISLFTVLDWIAEYKEDDGPGLHEILGNIKSNKTKESKDVRLVVVFIVIPLALLVLAVIGALLEKLLLYIALTVLGVHIKYLLYAMLQVLTPQEVFGGTLALSENACDDISGCYEVAPTLSMGDKLKRITAMLFEKKAHPVKLDLVQFSAISPKQVEKGKYVLLNIAMYEEKARALVEKMITQADMPVKENLGSTQSVADNTSVTITLTSSDLNFEETETQIWQGRFLNFSYCAKVPQEYEKDEILFTATAYFNKVIATRLRFTVSCTADSPKRLNLTRQDISSAFVSYAHQDMQRVATLIMGMKKARPDMDIFFDVESLRSGEYWESILRNEIEDRDMLFLCWSQNAKESKWVNMEWRHALQCKGLDAIEPLPLVSPAVCPPPEELSCKHFNDKFLLYLQK